MNFNDLPLNVLMKLINYSAKVDGQSLDRVKGNSITRGGGKSIADLHRLGKIRG